MIVMWLDRSLNTSAATLGTAADVRIVYKGSAFYVTAPSLQQKYDIVPWFQGITTFCLLMTYTPWGSVTVSLPCNSLWYITCPCALQMVTHCFSGATSLT